ncbi:MAG: ABC transporter permease subunit [Acidimicrobiales bacterium]
MTSTSATSVDEHLVVNRTRREGHYGFGGLARSEWTKLSTVRSTMWTLGLTIVVGIGIGVLATAETRAHWASMSLASRSGFDAAGTSLVGMFFAQLTIGILGVLVMSGEYGTGTIRATFSAVPRRPLVLAAKTLVFGAVALVVCEIVSFVSFFVGQALLSAPATHASLSTPGALRQVVGSGLFVCVIGLFALGLSVIIRHTAGGIAAFVGILLVLPAIAAALPNSLHDDVVRYLPSRIGGNLMSQSPDVNAFSPWVGFAVMCAYAAGLLIIGGILLVRRDA